MQKTRCAWCKQDPLYMAYHDEEWGVPVYDDDKLFEFLLLETFQAGLSWITILKKRDNFKKAFDHFDYKKIALYDEETYLKLLQNPGIIRNKLKIKSAIKNAQAFLSIQEEFGSFSNFIWAFVDRQPQQHQYSTLEEVPATTPVSVQISKALKKSGFSFVGPTVVYAFMQATGMVNDHITSCFRHAQLSS